MISNSPIRKIISAYFFAAVACPHLVLPVARCFFLLLHPQFIQYPRFQDLHCSSFIFVLRPLVLALHDRARRYMRDSHRGIRDIHMLAASPARAIRVYLQILRVYLHIHVLSLGKHCYCHSRSVYPPGRLCNRNALHPVRAALVFESLVHVLALYRKYHLFKPAYFCNMTIHYIYLPSASRSILRVHPE